MSTPDWTRREGLALLTDLYELTMMAGYARSGRAEQRVQFEYFFRSLPPHGGFVVTAGWGRFWSIWRRFALPRTTSPTCAG